MSDDERVEVMARLAATEYGYDYDTLTEAQKDEAREFAREIIASGDMLTADIAIRRANGEKPGIYVLDEDERGVPVARLLDED